MATNRSDLFWKAHSNPTRKPEGFYSEDFKDLITCMLQFHPHQRLCIADIIGHPWLSSGETASAEEVRANFSQRHETNKVRDLEERNRRKALRNQQQPNQTRRDVQIGGRVYLSAGEEIPTDADYSGYQIVNLQLKDFDAAKVGKFSFFSTFQPGTLGKQVMERLTQDGITCKMSETHWKFTFEAEKDSLFSYENDAVQESSILRTEKSTVQVEIFKVPDQEKFCVDFQRKAGSAMLYYDHVRKYIDQLALYNNTTLEEEVSVENEGAAAQQ